MPLTDDDDDDDILVQGTDQEKGVFLQYCFCYYHIL